MIVNCRYNCKKYSQWDDPIPNPIKSEMVLQGYLQQNQHRQTLSAANMKIIIIIGNSSLATMGT